MKLLKYAALASSLLFGGFVFASDSLIWDDDPIVGDWFCGSMYADPSGATNESNAGASVVSIWGDVSYQSGIITTWDRSSTDGYLNSWSTSDIYLTKITAGVYRLTVGSWQANPGPGVQFYQVVLSPDNDSFAADMLVYDGDSARGTGVYTAECQRMTDYGDPEDFGDYMEQWPE
jgi:hypothetical protein